MKYITSLLFALIVFITVPIQILYHNYNEFLSLEWFYIISLGGSFLFLVTVFIVYRLLTPRYHIIISKLLFVLSIYILLADILTPLSIKELETGTETPVESLQQIVIQPILFFSILILFINRPAKLINRLALPILIGILLTDIYYIVNLNIHANLNTKITDSHSSINHSFNGNIYHFMFDMYLGGPWIVKCIEDLNLEKDFDGFISFQNARSNYVSTKASVPSFLSGTLYDGKEKFGKWVLNTYKLSLLNILKKEGFRTHVYTARRSSGNDYANSNNIIGEMSPTFGIDLWLLRIVPAILRQEVFHDGTGLLSRNWGSLFNVLSGDLRSYYSYQSFKQLMKDESDRRDNGEYVFSHINPPHQPYQMNRYGIFVGKSDYIESSYLATNMMADFIRLLKKNGKFSKSLIIFHSDHGYQGRPVKELDWGPIISKADSLKIKAADVKRWPGPRLDFATRALLLIKLPEASDSKLEMNYNLVQLLDIPIFIQNVIAKNYNLNTSDVVNILGRDEVHIFHMWRKGKKARKGKDSDPGFLNHYSVTKDNQWIVHDNIYYER